MSRECKATRASVHAYLDGALTARQASRVAAHAAACAECREALAAAGRVRTLLREQPQPEAPPGLAAAINARVRQELREPVRAAFAWRRVALPAAAAAAVVLTIVGVRTLTVSPRGPVVAEAPGEAEAPPMVADRAPVETPASTVQDAPVMLAEVAPEDSAAARTTSSRPTRRVGSGEGGEPAAEDAVAAAEESPADPGPAPAAETHLAFADGRSGGSVGASGSVVEMAMVDTAGMDALSPRISPGGEAPAVPPDAPGPETAGLEGELATGVVARMLVSRFIADELIDTPPTLTAVLVGAPSEDLGPMLVGTRDDRFPLCFTDAMRKFLSEAQE
jgi:anti-sigma factor (TIGR02949 family)